MATAFERAELHFRTSGQPFTIEHAKTGAPMNLKIVTAACLLSTFSGICHPPARAADAPLPAEIASAFEVPSEWKDALGSYRSPLLFQDGSPVQTPADWNRRRDEIARGWHEVMGPWAGIIDNPRVEYLERTERDGFIQHRVRVEIAPEQTELGYLLVPIGAVNAGAVFVPFYDPETSIGLGKPMRDFAYQLARRGFVTLAIGSPGGDARKPELGVAKCQPLSFLAYVAANCANVLANLKEVDARRIGVVGHSYGGKWAMFAACLNERYLCAAWSDPGVVFDETRPNVNYWDPWYVGATDGPPRPVGLPSPERPRTGAYKILRERGWDLHELHALMAPRPFLVSGGSEDPVERWTALNHTGAVNRLLGYAGRVGMTNRPHHEPTAESNEQIYRFFEHFLGSPADQ